VTHHEKDFGDYLEEVIIKIDGAIEHQRSLIRQLELSVNNIGTQAYIIQGDRYLAHIAGLQEAKTILLGG